MTEITVKFITLGCKTNIYESEAMAELFRRSGHEVVSGGAAADVCVINTCTVTGTGAGKSRKAVRRAKRQNPDAVIAVTGCLAQTEPDEVRGIGADIIIGNDGRSRIVELAEAALSGGRRDIVDDIMKVREYEELPTAVGQSRTRANLKIEDGCDNFCAYCVIPYARGPVRSRPLENITAEAETLAEAGYREIVLTGIHIGSYGKDLKSGLSLIDVLEALNGISGVERVRLGSIEPPVITRGFVERASRLKSLCPHFHMSLQSGCGETLRRMKRRYTPDEYYRAVGMLREMIPDASITTDLMVGFPGETDEEFEESYGFCEKVGFMRMHVFKYSVRNGTEAERLPNHVSERVKEERSRRVIRLAERMRESFYKKYDGAVLPVLLEKRQNGVYHGTTPNYMDAYMRAEPGLEGAEAEIVFSASGESEIINIGGR